MDVTVSALGDSKNLQGGTLLVTPCSAPTAYVYAVAQGSVAISGFEAEGAAASITRGVPTVGRIAQRPAIIETRDRDSRSIACPMCASHCATPISRPPSALRLRSTTSRRQTAEPIPIPRPCSLRSPPNSKGNVAFLTEIEQLQVEDDLAAKIVIDERSGIIVMGRDVRVATVAVAQGNLTVAISESPQVSQPLPRSRGRTVVTPNSRVGVTEDDENSRW